MGNKTKPKTRRQVIRWLQNPHTDSAEYKAYGNSVAVPCVFFVLAGIVWAIDPTETANRIRSMMYAAGFSMIEESDKGYNQPAYDSATRQYTVQWTWCLRGDVN